MKLVAVVTPAYNRGDLLVELFESLKNQTSKNFKWYIIDDGSKDDTENICKNFIKSKAIDIEYVKKENGGKHTAINKAMEIVVEPMTLIVDSDDTLLSIAIETIEKDYKDIENDESLCGLGYLKYNKKSNENVGAKYTKDVLIDYFINERINRNVYGDKCEVFKTSVLKQYPFPVFKGERFISEAVVWCDISLKYKMKFFNVYIYSCEYLEGGLSDGIHRTIFNNPQGAVACYLKMSAKPVCLKYRIKYTIAFATYAFAAKMKIKEQYKRANSKFLYICTFGLAYLIYLRKKCKYKRN